MSSDASDTQSDDFPVEADEPEPGGTSADTPVLYDTQDGPEPRYPPKDS